MLKNVGSLLGSSKKEKVLTLVSAAVWGYKLYKNWDAITGHVNDIFSSKDPEAKARFTIAKILYEMMSSGAHDGRKISAGTVEFIQEVNHHLDNLEKALVAAPMDEVPALINRAFGEEEVEVVLPQVMEIFQKGQQVNFIFDRKGLRVEAVDGEPGE